jgi:hypothetical protein
MQRHAETQRHYVEGHSFRCGLFYSRPVTALSTADSHRFPYRECSLGKRHFVAYHVPWTFPLMSAIKAGHMSDSPLYESKLHLRLLGLQVRLHAVAAGQAYVCSSMPAGSCHVQ